jgi:hypothetical protein
MRAIILRFFSDVDLVLGLFQKIAAIGSPVLIGKGRPNES